MPITSTGICTFSRVLSENGAVLAMHGLPKAPSMRQWRVVKERSKIELKKRLLRACEKVKACERYRIQCT